MRSSRGALAALAMLLLVGACGGDDAERGVWFIHATDPHLFEERKTNRQLEGEAHAREEETVDEARTRDEREMAAWERESCRAFVRLLEVFDALPDTDARPRFLLLTGDLGHGEDIPGHEGGPTSGPASDAAETGEAIPAATALPALTTDQLDDGRPDIVAPAGETSLDDEQIGDTTTARVESWTEPLSLCDDSAVTRLRLSRKSEERAQYLIRLLEPFPAIQILFVPGNNDVSLENIANLEDSRLFIQSAGTRIVDLTACYRRDGAVADCPELDIPDTRYRLIGFPTFSFKKPDDKVQFAGRDQVHLDWMEHLKGRVDEARRDDRRVLIATHVSDLNDPYWQAQGELYPPQDSRTQRQDAVEEGNAAHIVPWSSWWVTPETYRLWRKIVDRPAVSRVLAGHLHDNHKDVYRQPYSWVRQPAGVRLAGPSRNSEKLWIAPPLGVRLQDKSPIQARGFALVGLFEGRTVRRLYWYDQARGVFEPEEPFAVAAPEPGWVFAVVEKFCRAIRWLWTLPGDGDPLGKAATILVALTAAFLTIVAIWKIPPTDTRLRARPSGSESAASSTAASSPFDNNFSRTVIAGLGGLAGVAFVDSLWERTDADGLDLKTYYVVCFLLFFLFLLVGYTLLRGLVEMTRARIASEHRPAKRAAIQTSPPDERKKESLGGKLYDFFTYWLRRFWRWLLSLRASFVVFFDAAFNVVQGQNHLESAVLGHTVVDLQKSLVRSVDEIADEVDRVIGEALLASGHQLKKGDCRVNVSVMSDDGKSLSYISLESGSLREPFTQRSLAWVAATVGEARWWRSVYGDFAGQIDFYDNSGGTLEGFEKNVKLGSVYEERGGSAYEAFVVLPLPWRRGGRQERKGALHISFTRDVYLHQLWRGLDRTNPSGNPDPRYAEHRSLVRDPSAHGTSSSSRRQVRRSSGLHILRSSYLVGPLPATGQRIEPVHPEVNAVLHMALTVLPVLLQRFNPILYEDLIKPR